MNVLGVPSILIVLLHISCVELLIVRRYFQDGILYEDYAADSDNVRYTTTEGVGWNDLEALAEDNELRGKAMFCSRGPGAWLLYQASDYNFGTSRKLKLICGEHCVPVDNVNSLQPLAPLNGQTKIGAVMYFSEKYFASKGELLKAGSGGSATATMKSAIFIGVGNWTLTSGGKTYCISILGPDGDTCLLEDIQAGFGVKDEEATVMDSCDNSTEEVYHMQSCYGQGFHQITYEFDFTLPQLKKICGASSYSAGDQSHAKFLNLMKIWDQRFVYDPLKVDKVKDLEDIPNGEQRLNILWNMVTLMTTTCSTVDPEYMEILKQVFLIHINRGRIWENDTTPDLLPIEQDPLKWMEADKFIQECTEAAMSSSGSTGVVPPVFHPGCTPRPVTDMHTEQQENVMEDFLLGEDFDFVIEQIWLILNYASPYCNYLMGFNDNYWSDFPHLFKRDFFYPIQHQWKSPDWWTTIYPLMFNGFDIEEERKSLIGCVQEIILKTPFYDPLARPPDFFLEKANSTLVTGSGKPPGSKSAKREAIYEKSVEVVVRTEQTIVPPTETTAPQSLAAEEPRVAPEFQGGAKEEQAKHKKKKGGKHKKGKKHVKKERKEKAEKRQSNQ